MDKDKKILEAISNSQEKIIQEEKKIDKQEKKLYDIENLLKKLLKKNSVAIAKEEKNVSSEMNFVQKYLANKSKKHKIFFQLVVVFAVILVWRGLWQLFDQTPFISSWEVSIIVGLIILWLFNKLADLS